MSARRQVLLDSLGVFALARFQKVFMKPDMAVVERKGRKLGDLVYKLDKRRRALTMRNLELAFPEMDASTREQTARDVFRHWGMVAADFLRTPLRSDEELLANMEVEGIEHYESVAHLEHGMIAVTAHFGNFERFGHWCTTMGHPITVVARAANQGGVQERIAQIRARTGMEVLTRGDSARTVISKLRKNELIGLLPDQNSNESFIPFFGHPAGTVLGPAKLHQRTGAAILPAYCARVGVGKFKVIILPPIDPGNEEKDAEGIMAQYNEGLESVVRRYPDQYLWLHDRWKAARRKGLVP